MRTKGPNYVASKIADAPKGSVIVVNAADEADMDVVILGILQGWFLYFHLLHDITTVTDTCMSTATQKGTRVLYRTGAAFVSARLGISPIPPITAQQLSTSFTADRGGLIIAGSYVPKTTAQLAILRERSGSDLAVVELDVEKLLRHESNQNEEDILATALEKAESEVSNGQDVLLMTSRKLITGANERESLDIGTIVARSLVLFLQRFSVRPRYVIAKGGITSSDMATKGLNIKKALIAGQASSGVPLWRCDEESCKWKGLPYVVFPGNVGSESALYELVRDWKRA